MYIRTEINPSYDSVPLFFLVENVFQIFPSSNPNTKALIHQYLSDRCVLLYGGNILAPFPPSVLLDSSTTCTRLISAIYSPNKVKRKVSGDEGEYKTKTRA